MIADHTIPREVWLEAGKQGFFGLTIPEEFGGAGIDDYRFNAVLAEELAKFNVAVSSCFGIHADITAPYIVALGTEEQKQRWLPQVATGEKILSIGMTEPNGGSDLAALKSTAVKADDGSGDWIINGSKTFITNGHQCDLAVVAIRTDPSKGAKGISLFVLEKEDEGFTKGQPLDKVGQPESDTSELFFDNVRVPADRLLGPEGMGFISMMQKLPQERLGNAVGCVAHAAQIDIGVVGQADRGGAVGGGGHGDVQPRARVVLVGDDEPQAGVDLGRPGAGQQDLVQAPFRVDGDETALVDDGDDGRRGRRGGRASSHPPCEDAIDRSIAASVSSARGRARASPRTRCAAASANRTKARS